MATTNSTTHAGQPVFSPISHPILKEPGLDATVAFIKNRNSYIKKIGDANISGATLSPVSLLSSIDEDLLRSMVVLDMLPGIEKYEDITDETLLRWLDKVELCYRPPTTPKQITDAVIKNVRISYIDANPKSRIQSLFIHYVTFLRSRNWDFIISNNTNLAVTHICALLRPYALQKHIETKLSLEKEDLKTDWKGFFSFVTERATAFEEFYPLVGSDNENGTKVSKESVSVPVAIPKIMDSSNQKVLTKTTKESKPESTDPDTTKEDIEEKNKKKIVDCLNKNCQGKHLLKDCPNTDESTKKQIFKDFYSKEKPANSMSAMIDIESTATNGKFMGKLEDEVIVSINGDYGADISGISEKHIKDCEERGLFIPIKRLEDPIQVSLALSDPENPQIFCSKKKARISITLALSIGPLRLKNVEFLVFEENLPEVILSRPLLQSMGFDLSKHLTLVRDNYHDTDFSHVNYHGSDKERPTTGLSSILINHNETTADPLPLPEINQTGPDTNTSHNSYPITPSSNIETKTNEVGELTLENNDETEIGEENPEKTKAELLERIAEAATNGLPEHLQPTLKTLVLEYSDIFRLQMGYDPPAKLPPLRIKLEQNFQPVRVKPRNYTPPQRKFLSDKVDELLKLNLIYRNNESSWASAPLIVPKQGSELYRFTVDLRQLNAQTLVHAWPMPRLESITTDMAGANCFASIDLCHCYWQFPVEKACQELQSFITPDGVYTPTRVLHGLTNAVAHVQSTVSEICLPIRNNLLQWIDDMLIHCQDAKQLLDVLEQFFSICRTHNLKLHARKCRLFMTEVLWCGRIISGQGIKLDPSRLKALIEMPVPDTGAQLQQFVCAANWMRMTIPEYNKIVEPLNNILEDVYKISGKRTRRSIQSIDLSKAIWTASHTEAFENLKNAIASAVTLSHPAADKQLCLYTDASEYHWAAILTQIPRNQINLPVSEQHHAPIAFLSGSFRGSSFRWSTIEKESYAIVASVKRLDYILARPEGFLLFTDHKNLTYILHPTSMIPHMPRHVMNKVQRWAIILTSFNYTISHIDGSSNEWADLLSRWGTKMIDANNHSRISSMFVAPIAPGKDPDFSWPSIQEIIEAQSKAESEDNLKVNGFTQDRRNVYRDDQKRIWIPSKSTTLQLRICIIAHCGRGGHRGKNTTLQHIQDFYTWRNMTLDVTAFCNSCLHCQATAPNIRVPRPLASTVHADKPNQLIHFDYLYMGESSTSEVYVLIIKDDATSYTWLTPCKSADAEHTVQALLTWFAAFGVAPSWVSDKGSHFKNTVMTHLNKALHAHHHFTTPYNPQSNGTVERVCQEVLRAARALLSEFRLHEDKWPAVIKIIQSILNNSKRPSLDNNAPITAFTGLPADNPLRTLLPLEAEEPATIEFIQASKIANIDKLTNALELMHRKTSDKRTKLRQQAIQKHNLNTNIAPINFEIGDFVLVGKIKREDGHKLQVTWQGPYQVVRAPSSLVYEIENLITKKTHLVHCNRLRFYSDKRLNVTETLKDTIFHNSGSYNIVQDIIDLKWNPEQNEYQLLVKWKDFEDETPGWEPLQAMMNDIPDMVNKFLDKLPDKALLSSVRKSLC